MQEHFYESGSWVQKNCASLGVHPGLSVQLRSNSSRWLHREVPRERHQMRHLCDFARFLTKQVLARSRHNTKPSNLHLTNTVLTCSSFQSRSIRSNCGLFGQQFETQAPYPTPSARIPFVDFERFRTASTATVKPPAQ